MNKPRSYTISEVLNYTNIALNFEFYSSKGLNFMVNELKDVTMKDVIYSKTDSTEPTSYSVSILSKIYNTAKPKYSLKLYKQHYNTMIPIMNNVLEWIERTSDCRSDDTMSVSLSFDERHLKLINSISNMNVHKLMLKINENYIWDRFKEREHSPYLKSIISVVPKFTVNYSNDILKNVNYIIPKPDDVFSGINFKNQHRGELIFNYIGGSNYSEKRDDILETIQYFIVTTYKSLNETDYTPEEVAKLKEYTTEFYKMQDAFYDFKIFKEIYPDIKVYINLNRNEQILMSYWPKIRNSLFNAIITNGLKKGEFNYDSEIGSFQLREAKINCSGLANFDLVNCEISGEVKYANIISCKIKNARIYKSNIVLESTIENSYLFHTTVERTCKIQDAIVDNNYEIINCNVYNSIIIHSGFGKEAKVDEDTMIVDRYTPLDKFEDEGISVEKVRDYKWIKSFTANKDQGYANEYKKKKLY